MLNGSTKLHVPYTMEDEDAVKLIFECGNLEKAAARSKITIESAMTALVQLRCKHDFEFWTATCVDIQTKYDGVKKFVLNRPQRKLLAVMESMRLRNVPIRVILLKARQWGGSTLVQLYIAWIQLFHRTNWNAMIVAAKKDQSLHIRGMYSRMADAHPANIIDGVSRVKMSPYMLTQNIRIVEGRDCIVGVGSVEEPDSIRSYTTHMLHLSECGLWKSTSTVNAQKLAATLEGGLVTAPYTLLVKESTAKGVGNYFHEQWQKAEAGKTLDKPVFVSWFEDPNEYHEKITNVKDFIEKFIQNTDPSNEYWRYLWKLGATAEHIAWYITKSKSMDAWDMKTEFPSTATEAFQSTGQRVFPISYVLQAREACTEPKLIGNLSAKSSKGPDSFKDLLFEESPGGYLKIWTLPGKLGNEKPGMIYTNRYVAFGDVGGASKGADYSCITVLDRIHTLKGGVPYVCAEWHGHLDHDLFAWYGARLCYWYQKALYAVETNSLVNDHGDVSRGFEADHSLTILDEIKSYYPNMYYRVKPETIQEKWTGVLGFNTNRTTKVMIIDNLKGALREDGYEERNTEACDEFDWYEQKTNGSMGAIDKKHDDRVISRAGAVWLSSQMEPVREIDPTTTKAGTAKSGGFANF